MSNLAARLHNMQPQESDAYLSTLWRQFAGSEQHDALLLAIAEIVHHAEAGLFSPHTRDPARAHFAGQVAALRRLQITIQAAISFDPDRADYTPAEPVFSDEIPGDDDQLI